MRSDIVNPSAARSKTPLRNRELVLRSYGGLEPGGGTGSDGRYRLALSLPFPASRQNEIGDLLGVGRRSADFPGVFLQDRHPALDIGGPAARGTDLEAIREYESIERAVVEGDRKVLEAYGGLRAVLRRAVELEQLMEKGFFSCQHRRSHHLGFDKAVCALFRG